MSDLNIKHQATNTLIIYHNNDMDGISSGLIAAKTMKLVNKNVAITYKGEFSWNITGYNYGKNPEEDTWLKLVDDNNQLLFNHIIFIDVTPPLEFIEKCIPYLSDNKLVMQIFDHHENVYTQIRTYLKNIYFCNDRQNIQYTFNNEYCGSYIFWLAVCNSNFICDTYGFLFSSTTIEKETNFFHKFTKNIKTVEVPIIYKSIKNAIDNSFEVDSMYKFFGTISKFDTWGWYNEDPKKREYACLQFNEGFMELWKHKFKENLQEMYDYFFDADDYFRPEQYTNCASIGYAAYQTNVKLALQTKHSLAKFSSWNLAIINSRANYYDTETVKNIYHNTGNVVDAVLYFGVDLLTGKSNISLRALNNSVNCIDIVKELTDGNGGGHLQAAGGQMNTVDLINKLEPLKFPTYEELVKQFNDEQLSSVTVD